MWLGYVSIGLLFPPHCQYYYIYHYNIIKRILILCKYWIYYF